MTAARKGELQRAFASVPLEGGNPKYVPLDRLPVGTELTFTTKEPAPPTDPDQIPEINGKPEEHVTYLPADTYKLRILEWGVAELTIGDREKRLCKPLYKRLSITSPFIANYDDMFITFRIHSGNIKSISVGRFRLDESQIEKDKKKERPRRKSRRHGPRGSYKPLRNRRM